MRNIPVLGAITAGHFKEPFSLEELTSSRFITFMERALPNNMVPGRNLGIMASDARKLWDDQKRLTWALGLFRDRGDEDEGETFFRSDGGYDMTGRVTCAPWYADGGEKVAHVGVSYSLRHPEDPIRYRARPEAHFIEERFSDTGNFVSEWVNLFGAEAAVVYGPFSVQSEYIGNHVESDETGDPCLNGWYVQGSYFLTGEHRNYKTSKGAFDRVHPKKNFREDGGWGAWEVALRYSYLDLDDSRLPDEATDMHDVTVGLNWYLNPNVRVMWNYIRSCADGLDVSNAADIFAMRMQVDF
jgi:phosphate-selective porin OprO/OprP